MRFLPALVALAFAVPSAAQPLPNYDMEELRGAIAQKDLGKIAVLAAEQGGKQILIERFDGKDAGTPIDIRSAGKSITALAVGAAIADGALVDTQVTIWPYLGRPRDEPWDSITVGDLLGMSSALDCNDWDRKSPGQEERMYRTGVWRDFALDLPAREYERDAQGEGPFSYCTAGVFLLGQVVEKATGQRFDTYVQQRIFDSLGIEGVIWRTSRSGEIQSGGQLTIGAEALLKIGRLVLDKGRWDGEQLVPESWVREMVAPRHQLGHHVHYGSLWWTTPLRSPRGYEGAVMMKGNGGNIVALVPTYDAVLVVQAENYNREDAERHAFTALTAMLGALEAPEGITAE
ncbi:serine hydrolase domain-containing protein [Qipengyuania aquimaris]|uniref:serine hydrolase domain-containing protein n=1 Tax=Qipengyuania aquimaris TaxID=255984 RepID=UPI001FCF983C|nr:serine hydrolase [Qipengyuania aquimaris]UOR15935.1 beta-lactamase family protein [Qipengyuania aquimaris]